MSTSSFSSEGREYRILVEEEIPRSDSWRRWLPVTDRCNDKLSPDPDADRQLHQYLAAGGRRSLQHPFLPWCIEFCSRLYGAWTGKANLPHRHICRFRGMRQSFLSLTNLARNQFSLVRSRHRLSARLFWICLTVKDSKAEALSNICLSIVMRDSFWLHRFNYWQKFQKLPICYFLDCLICYCSLLSFLSIARASIRQIPNSWYIMVVVELSGDPR